MKKSIFIIFVLVVLIISGCSKDLLTIAKDGPLDKKECKLRNLDGRVIVIEREGCSACRLAIPILKEVEDDLDLKFEYYDLAKKDDYKKIRELGLAPMYTPTTVANCNVIIGLRSKEEFKELIQNSLKNG